MSYNLDVKLWYKNYFGLKTYSNMSQIFQMKVQTAKQTSDITTYLQVFETISLTSNNKGALIENLW